MRQINEIDPGSLDDEDVLLDVREPNEFEAGHAPNAVSIPLGELRARVDEVPETRDGGPLPVICRSGARSMKAAMFLEEQGIDVVNVAGGTGAWFDGGKPLLAENGREPAVVAPTTQPPAQV